MAERAEEGRGSDAAWQVYRQGDAQVMAAMRLVAEHAAPSVIVSNIRDAADVVRELWDRAVELGIGLELLERRDGHGHDVRITGAAAEWPIR